MRLVLDTDVLVAGLRSAKGASRQLLILLDAGLFEALASVSMMLEYEAVLKRTENLPASGLTTEEVDRFLNSFAQIVLPVSPFYLWRPVLKDPEDEFILEAAINGQADAIVTFNVTDFMRGGRQFGIEILKPGEVLRRLEQCRT